ncbi:serine hydrolase domain-containing protein [Mycolicibacterium komossense]|uniref:Beta-lactamase family protein n=1 Tax=Mycolicibacterium komossense TaxID=1779 RepID=A0ABT3C909_9MYCO|nr:serine hydrolase domain-containing protein [Mycolicibacterium komossense]MCV7225957.1 beta-lactamase family protein [Mycolicibacterium komossense]
MRIVSRPTPPTTGPATGDPGLIGRVAPLLQGLRDRVSVVYIRNRTSVEAHFGAGPDAVYEIGSITKTMTALLFAQAVADGELTPGARLGSLLDLGGSAAADVTLEELASHRSGLPRIADRPRDLIASGFAVLRHRNPYTADLATLLTQARAAKLTDRGSFSYSNLGAALLGEALAAHAGTSYPALLERALLQRLGMTRTFVPVSAAELAPDAPTGWSANGQREQAWTLNAYSPAGGVRSTPTDMARYAQALLDRRTPGLSALEPRWDAGSGSRVGYAWFTLRAGNVDVTWHNGGTGGFSSMLALDREHGAAVVILANTAVAVDDIAIRILVDAT